MNSGRTAVVTGGARGIGLAAARQLVRDGFAVVVADLMPPEDDSLGFVRTDVSDRASVESPR